MFPPCLLLPLLLGTQYLIRQNTRSESSRPQLLKENEYL